MHECSCLPYNGALPDTTSPLPACLPSCLPACAEPSPVVVRGAAAAAAAVGRQWQQQQGGRGEIDLTTGASSGGSDSDGGSPASSDGLGAGGSRGGKRYGALAAGAAAAAAAADDGSRIELKLRNARGEKVLRMKRDDPFSKLFAAYRCAGGAGLVPLGLLGLGALLGVDVAGCVLLQAEAHEV